MGDNVSPIPHAFFCKENSLLWNNRKFSSTSDTETDHQTESPELEFNIEQEKRKISDLLLEIEKLKSITNNNEKIEQMKSNNNEKKNEEEKNVRKNSIVLVQNKRDKARYFYEINENNFSDFFSSEENFDIRRRSKIKRR